MIVLLWDASALAKRYAPEIGSDVVDTLFTSIPASQMISSAISYTEIYSLLFRKRNRKTIDTPTFEKAISLLRKEILDDPNLLLLSADDSAFYSGIPLMNAHNINSTDAALCVMFLRYIVAQQVASSLKFCVVTADTRMVRAMEAKGLAVINPETMLETEVSAFLASL